MTIDARNQPLLGAAIETAELEDVPLHTSQVLGGQYDRARKLFHDAGKTHVIELPDPAEEGEVAQWRVTDRSVATVSAPGSSVWFIFVAIRGDVDITDTGITENESTVALVMAPTPLSSAFNLDQVVELMRIYVSDEDEFGLYYNSPDLGDYVFTDQEVLDRYEGLLLAVEQDNAQIG